MLDSRSKRRTTLSQISGRPDENRNGEAAQHRRGDERLTESERFADRTDHQRSCPDAGIECPDDAAERAGAAVVICVLEDECGESRVRGAESESEKDRGYDT